MLVAQAEAQFEIWTGQPRGAWCHARGRGPAAADLDGAGAAGADRITIMKQTSFDEFKELASRGTFVPVCKEIIADLLTPVSAFLKIAEHSDYAFLLESVEGGEHVGRYSFLGKDPFLVVRARDGHTIVERAGQTQEVAEGFIPTVRRLMADFRAPYVPDLPRFTGGAVGYLAYDAAHWFEPVPTATGPLRAGGGRRSRGVHAVRHDPRVRSRAAPAAPHRQRAHHGRR